MNIMSTLVNYGQYKSTEIDHDKKKGQKNSISDGMGKKNGGTSYSTNIAGCTLKNDKATVFSAFTGAYLSRVKTAITMVFNILTASRHVNRTLTSIKSGAVFPANYQFTLTGQPKTLNSLAINASTLKNHQTKTTLAVNNNRTGSTRAEIVALNHTYLRSGIAALDTLNEGDQPTGRGVAAQDQAAMMLLVQKYQTVLNLPQDYHDLQQVKHGLDSLNNTADQGLATEQDKHETLRLHREIKAVLAEAYKRRGDSNTIAKSKARTRFDSAITTLLNSKPWNSIRASFCVDNKRFSSHLTPAGRLTLGEKTPLLTLGKPNNGICSKTTTSRENAVNLWTSSFEIQEAGQTHEVFAGIRHGVNSAYGLPKGAERDAAAVARAKQIVTAALAMQPEKLAQAREGNKINLQLTSTSLLTPIDLFSSTEKSQLQDQLTAWQTLSSTEGIELDVMDKHGKPITVVLEVAAFNFGVNGLSQGILKLGNAYSDEINLPAMKLLLGSNLSPSLSAGGWVQRYLATDPSNKKRVENLQAEIKEIWAKKSHHSDGEDPYKMATRIALLSYEIGIIPCWNCKSGKDRTGWMDTEIKYAVTRHCLNRTTEKSTAVEKKDKELLQMVALNSGNQKIQEQNTGAPGNKCFNQGNVFSRFFANLSLRHRLGNHHTADRIKGLSHLV
ncbi:inositol phosphate phosphatase SopB [Acerihabitans sp. TG2]|uniref:inositol phosphate phosphatase SopB n=1 Tax=Acerihabitans sp. TG2 TaxID=3096008 RepID=UPI002B23BF51|nr:inositol phosphate phosphatase SopB [Acerihabitans sp. TG2]MEA9393191.1 inositol phosphate phosphatase SopB [Acerihabitans sp. TG2]